MQDNFFWDMHYFWYIMGFLSVPRITLIVIFSTYVTDGFKWYNLFLPISIWFTYDVLSLGFWSKLFFLIFLIGFPRVLLGVIGYNYLSQENHFGMMVFIILGVIIDVGVKVLRHFIHRQKAQTSIA